jgi:hypothetical protein
MKPSMYSPEVYRETVRRIEAITPETKRLWGTMNAAQMLAHIDILFQQALGKMPIRRIPWLLKKFLKWYILSPKPFKKSERTGPDWETAGAEKNFAHEKSSVLANLKEVFGRGPGGIPDEHPAMGKITAEEWGFNLWKHTDHHLRQFGV